MTSPLWTPSPERRSGALMSAFAKGAARQHGYSGAEGIEPLWNWSTEDPAAFWRAVWDDAQVIGERGERTLENPAAMPGAQFFPDARLNFAENLLRSRGPAPAMIFRREDGAREEWSRDRVTDAVARLASAFHALGIVPGDRIAAVMPNIPETVVGMLAAASLGAIWSSCSPDFGTAGVLDRFGQIEPKVLISVDGYFYNGKVHRSSDKLPEIVSQLTSLEAVIIVPFANADAGPIGLPHERSWAQVLDEAPPRPLQFERLPFNHPLYIMFSSGTTGKPKCIVHGAGGTLLQHLKEHRLHCDLRAGEKLFYFTTCGWMMWNWLVTGLASDATLMLFDGSPFHPGPEALWQWAADEGIEVFGTSAKYLDALKKSGFEPRSLNLEPLRMVTSTGSPLAPETFEWIYEHIKNDLCLASISGGTDIISCFVLGNPTGPVWRGEAQTRGLGMAVSVVDEAGQDLVGTPGELICKKPFPSMPVGFWNDPDGSRYHAAYFDRFPGIWCHGDWVELTERGGMIIHGRSDATLNPGGVRIGTAEIYRQVEGLDEVLEAVVIGQDHDDDVRVVLFVRLREGIALDEALAKRIKREIRANTTPRHVPAVILPVADIPRTKSGKITELAVRDVVHGRPVKNIEALANPEALELFKDRPELKA